MKQEPLARHARTLAIAWAALLALMLTSLGSSYLSLGAGNAAAGLVIAVLKSAIVVWLFMRLSSASAMVRIVAVTALGTLLLLFALSGVDYATRLDEPAPVQAPQQIEPLVVRDRAAHDSPR